MSDKTFFHALIMQERLPREWAIKFQMDEGQGYTIWDTGFYGNNGYAIKTKWSTSIEEQCKTDCWDKYLSDHRSTCISVCEANANLWLAWAIYTLRGKAIPWWIAPLLFEAIRREYELMIEKCPKKCDDSWKDKCDKKCEGKTQKFDESSIRVELNSTLNPTGDYIEIVIYFKTDEDGASENMVLFSTQSSSVDWVVYIDNTNYYPHVKFTDSDGVSLTVNGNIAVNDGVMHKLVAVRDGSTVKLILDESDEWSDTASFTGNFNPLDDIWIGSNGGTSEFYKGEIKELGVTFDEELEEPNRLLAVIPHEFIVDLDVSLELNKNSEFRMVVKDDYGLYTNIPIGSIIKIYCGETVQASRHIFTGIITEREPELVGNTVYFEGTSLLRRFQKVELRDRTYEDAKFNQVVKCQATVGFSDTFETGGYSAWNTDTYQEEKFSNEDFEEWSSGDLEIWNEDSIRESSEHYSGSKSVQLTPYEDESVNLGQTSHSETAICSGIRKYIPISYNHYHVNNMKVYLDTGGSTNDVTLKLYKNDSLEYQTNHTISGAGWASLTVNKTYNYNDELLLEVVPQVSGKTFKAGRITASDSYVDKYYYNDSMLMDGGLESWNSNTDLANWEESNIYKTSEEAYSGNAAILARVDIFGYPGLGSVGQRGTKGIATVFTSGLSFLIWKAAFFCEDYIPTFTYVWQIYDDALEICPCENTNDWSFLLGSEYGSITTSSDSKEGNYSICLTNTSDINNTFIIKYDLSGSWDWSNYNRLVLWIKSSNTIPYVAIHDSNNNWRKWYLNVRTDVWEKIELDLNNPDEIGGSGNFDISSVIDIGFVANLDPNETLKIDYIFVANCAWESSEFTHSGGWSSEQTIKKTIKGKGYNEILDIYRGTLAVRHISGGLNYSCSPNNQQGFTYRYIRGYIGYPSAPHGWLDVCNQSSDSNEKPAFFAHEEAGISSAVANLYVKHYTEKGYIKQSLNVHTNDITTFTFRYKEIDYDCNHNQIKATIYYDDSTTTEVIRTCSSSFQQENLLDDLPSEDKTITEIKFEQVYDCNGATAYNPVVIDDIVLELTWKTDDDHDNSMYLEGYRITYGISGYIVQELSPPYPQGNSFSDFSIYAKHASINNTNLGNNNLKISVYTSDDENSISNSLAYSDDTFTPTDSWGKKDIKGIITDLTRYVYKIKIEQKYASDQNDLKKPVLVDYLKSSATGDYYGEVNKNNPYEGDYALEAYHAYDHLYRTQTAAYGSLSVRFACSDTGSGTPQYVKVMNTSGGEYIKIGVADGSGKISYDVGSGWVNTSIDQGSSYHLIEIICGSSGAVGKVDGQQICSRSAFTVDKYILGNEEEGGGDRYAYFDNVIWTPENPEYSNEEDITEDAWSEEWRSVSCLDQNDSAVLFARDVKYDKIKAEVGRIASGAEYELRYYKDGSWLFLSYSDGTSNMTSDGVLNWNVPDDWKSETLTVGSITMSGYIMGIFSRSTPTKNPKVNRFTGKYTIREILNSITDTVKDYYPRTIIKGKEDLTESIEKIEFKNVNCLRALQLLAENYGYRFFIDKENCLHFFKLGEQPAIEGFEIDYDEHQPSDYIISIRYDEDEDDVINHVRVLAKMPKDVIPSGKDYFTENSAEEWSAGSGIVNRTASPPYHLTSAANEKDDGEGNNLAIDGDYRIKVETDGNSSNDPYIRYEDVNLNLNGRNFKLHLYCDRDYERFILRLYTGDVDDGNYAEYRFGVKERQWNTINLDLSSDFWAEVDEGYFGTPNLGAVSAIELRPLKKLGGTFYIDGLRFPRTEDLYYSGTSYDRRSILQYGIHAETFFDDSLKSDYECQTMADAIISDYKSPTSSGEVELLGFFEDLELGKKVRVNIPKLKIIDEEHNIVGIGYIFDGGAIRVRLTLKETKMDLSRFLRVQNYKLGEAYGV